MSDVQYYRLELEDCSAVSFCSLGKYYFETLEEISSFISVVDRECKDSHREVLKNHTWDHLNAWQR